ncbi:MAG: ATP-dependent RNA helicase HrpA, partial [Desulfobacteraceae bacterium]|nr:ATP-dependent RNA helicase HrpA [Desulfobacteraceae bacterium]
MDGVKRIEKLIAYVMLKDQHSIYKQLKSIKKACHNTDDSGKKMQAAAQRLLEKTQKSVDENKRRQQKRPTQIKFDKQLPIVRKKDEIIHAIKSHNVLIISGETGSGKTTQIPKFCLEAGQGIRGMIGCTQPRRIAAVNVASRIAFELNEKIGASVGYKIRFDDKISRHAHIKLMTDGILLAETQSDRFLNQYDTIIVDEAHERSLNIDFTLGILRNLVKKRKDLKLIITSATIDTEKFSKAFDNAPIIEVSGRMYPVQVKYMALTDSKEETESIEDQGYVETAVEACDHILSTTKRGDILVFMPTEQDIGETLEMLRGRNHPGVSVLPLFARLSAKEQSKVFSIGAGRKIIVATNVAETSLTIPGIKYVIDTGLARIPHYSPRTRTTALPVSPISRSSADQRKGRCGRIENGICIRLYDEDDYNSRPFFTSPEILRSNLAEVILRMINLHLGEVSSFPFIDPPAPKSIKDGFDTLIELCAINEKPNKKRGKKEYALTRMGRIMARIPVDPKLSRILIEADRQGCLKEAIIIVTALAISDPRQRPAEKAQAADQKHALFKDPASDFVTLLNIWKAFQAAKKNLKSRSKLRKYCQDHFLSFKRIWEWIDIHRQIKRMLSEYGIEGKKPKLSPKGTKGFKKKEFEVGGPLYTTIHKSLLSGYLSNIAHKKEKNIFNAAKGQQAMIFPGSGLFNCAGTWIVAAEFVKTSQLFARGVANIDPNWIEDMAKDLCTYTYSDPHWEKKRGEVVAKQQVSLFGLTIANDRNVAYGRINPDEAGEIFIRHALIQGEI